MRSSSAAPTIGRRPLLFRCRMARGRRGRLEGAGQADPSHPESDDPHAAPPLRDAHRHRVKNDLFAFQAADSAGFRRRPARGGGSPAGAVGAACRADTESSGRGATAAKPKCPARNGGWYASSGTCAGRVLPLSAVLIRLYGRNGNCKERESEGRKHLNCSDGDGRGKP